MSGFNLPPGVSIRDIDRATGADRDDICDCCCKPISQCNCPECRMCGACGDPTCYGKSKQGTCGLRYNNTQLSGQFAAIVWTLEDRAEEAKRAAPDYDPTPWCAHCGAMRARNCRCGPIPEND